MSSIKEECKHTFRCEVTGQFYYCNYRKDLREEITLKDELSRDIAARDIKYSPNLALVKLQC